MPKAVALPPELLTRGVEQIIDKKHLEARLKSGQKLRIKHGVDPTTDQLHIGYAVVYWKLRQFQELGHTIVFLIGDFTARFGDPTDKIERRQMRDRSDVLKLAKGYLDQIKGILDLDKTEIRRNAEWYDQMSAEELLRLASNFSVAQMLERDMFAERQRSGKEIGLHEPLYPVLQGYDSVRLKSDLTVIGTDQLFNELAARPLQQRAGQEPQAVMAMSLLIGTDGKRKMSQSYGNTIGITEPPADQFAKVMRIPDGLISHYFELATLLTNRELAQIERAREKGELSPRDAKLRLGREIVALFHGQAASQKAEERWLRVVSKRELPEEIAEHRVAVNQQRLDQLLLAMKLATSRSEAQRLIVGGGVKIDGAPMGDWRAEIALHDGMVIQVGKKKFKKIRTHNG